MNTKAKTALSLATATILAVGPGCTAPKSPPLPPIKPSLPALYPGANQTTNAVLPGWREFFRDPVLRGLITTAVTNNQELNILLQEVAAAQAQAGARKGALFPFLKLGGGAGAERPSRNTTAGAVEESVEIRPGRKNPEPLPNYGVTADLEWEVDIWRRLRNERDASIKRYLATEDGRRFAITRLVAEIAESYYDVQSLDAQLRILERMVELQEKALESVRLKKLAGRVTELAVRRFEAEILKNRGRLFEVRQRIVEAENRLATLAGRYPQSIPRGEDTLSLDRLADIQAGIPSELLRNRPDVRQAELELEASGLEVKAAAARFYPELSVSAALGLQSFALGSPIFAKENLAYGATANLVGPLVNRSTIKAAFQGATARQVAAVYRYQQTVLKAYVEVANELSRILNTQQEYTLKSEQVAALDESVGLSRSLFDSARADYTEVLLTQREALESRIELIELRQTQLMAAIKTYRAIGGGAIDSTTRPTTPTAVPSKAADGQKPAGHSR